MSPEKSIFFGYPSQPPLLRETVRNAASEIASTRLVESRLWEDASGSSHLLISDITRAIDEATLSSFVLTDLNPNVMFETGYAIGAKKHVWLLLNPSKAESKKRWDRFNLLTPVRYVEYKSVEDIKVAFLKELPHEDMQPTIFETVIQPSLDPVALGRLFYMRSVYEDEAARQFSRRIERARREGWEVTLADPIESSYTITWYARQVYSSSGVVIHLAPTDVQDADIHNARCALVGGLAYGMNRPLLILAEEGFETPVDYREVLRRYATSIAGSRAIDEWIEAHRDARPRPTEPWKDLGTELRGLRLGEDVAENEADRLSDYFVETAGYYDVLEKRTTIFVGRKGTGKTANLLRAADELANDRRNLVVVIKPSGYEVEAVVRLLSRELPSDIATYLIEGLWQYLLETEIALAALEEARTRPAGVSGGTPEWNLQRLIDKSGFDKSEFAVRLESLVKQLSELILDVDDVTAARHEIMDALHTETLGGLRRALVPVLQERERVCVLIDNLDRAWDRSSDINRLSSLFLGLLVAIGRLETDFRKAGIRAGASLAVFLRTDIFHHVKSVAREPDKLRVSELRWEESELLARLIESRYASTREGVVGTDLWARFAPTTRDVETRRYILSRILPRPRDLIHFCNAAIVSAVNSGNAEITEEDVLKAEAAYSQFVYDVVRVENGISVSQLEAILYEFAGSQARLSRSEVTEQVLAAGIAADGVDEVIERLRDLSFLGLEVADGNFRYSESPDDARLVEARSSRFRRDSGNEPRFEIHPAFRAYLEIAEPAEELK